MYVSLHIICSDLSLFLSLGASALLSVSAELITSEPQRSRGAHFLGTRSWENGRSSHSFTHCKSPFPLCELPEAGAPSPRREPVPAGWLARSTDTYGQRSPEARVPRNFSVQCTAVGPPGPGAALQTGLGAQTDVMRSLWL